MGQAPQPKMVLVVGWNGAGKTAVVQRLRGHSSEPPPTTGVLREVATLRCGPEGGEMECLLELVDVGSVPKLEAKTASYQPWLAMADAVIVVLDATRTCLRFRPEEVQRAKVLMETIAQEPEVRDKPFLVLANKCDREDAIPVSEMLDTFRLEDTFQGRAWHLQRCSAVTAEGLKPGYAWLLNKLLSEAKLDNHAAHRGETSRPIR
mmetsp:Transcript_4761/g.14932  ORF Transcript_4761/g.14932 Transcript_4761/m.14932 type:complete len:206 (+) Transcript_4761:90-707(+)